MEYESHAVYASYVGNPFTRNYGSFANGLYMHEYMTDREWFFIVDDFGALVPAFQNVTALQNRYHTQGGGIVRWDVGRLCYIFVEPPHWGCFQVGDSMPEEWSVA